MNNNKKVIVAVALMTLLIVTALSSSTPAFSKEQSESGKKNSEKGKDKGKGEKGQDQGEKAGAAQAGTNSTAAKSKGQSNTNKNSTSQSSSQPKSKGEKPNNKEKSGEVKGKSMHAEKAAEHRHTKHLAKNVHAVGPYTANMNYTLTATGTATLVSDNSTSKDATISIALSIWKSTKGMVAMDVMSGTVKIGKNETHSINTGNALYSIGAHKMMVNGLLDGMDSRLTLKIAVPKDSELPSRAKTSMQLNILSPESKLVSKWFLKMQGEITAS